MSDEERYRLTHELWMLWQMRHKVAGPLIRYDEDPGHGAPQVIRREIELARRLGFKHALDR